MYQPTLEEAMQYTDAYKMIPITRSCFSDSRTPIEVLRILKSASKHCYMLESVEKTDKWGRYTILGYDPKLEITCVESQNNIAKIQIKTNSGVEVAEGNPQDYLQTILNDYKSPKLKDMPVFTGGLVGYFSYDYLKYSEPSLKLDALDEENFKDVDLMLFDKVIVFDHFKQKIIFIFNIRTDNLEENYKEAQIELERMMLLATKGTAKPIPSFKLKTSFEPLFDKESFVKMVEQAKQYIYEGDIFQVVLSNRMEAEAEGSLFDTYRVLRTTNPSPYMFYFSSDEMEIAGASPETLVKLEQDTLYTYPLAGTRKRGVNEEEDRILEEELLSDPKELAEHNMLVDLGRNDIGKISEFGTVQVEKYMSVERYSHVMHIGSTIRGTIREDQSALDAIRAVLPAGTLSGAPKIRACEIINQLENNKRGIYGGAIGYLDFNGNMDTCIAIRIVFKKKNKVFIRSGAGIVADSSPEKEYEECIQKTKAVMNALKQSEGGVDV